jgi:sialate O-acetylesterase
MVKFPARKPGGPLAMQISGKNSVTVKNIVIGEVWVASGQSNMEFGFKQAHNVAEERPKAAYPKIRLFNLKKKTSFEPLADCEGKWEECTPDSVMLTSAVGYFFIRDLHKDLNEPVGLIHTSWGGTPAEAWTSLESLARTPELRHYADTAFDTKAQMPERMEQYRTVAIPKWEEEMKAWKEAENVRRKTDPTSKAKQAPRKPTPPDNNPNLGASLYNGMIAPIVPFGIEGAIWYQGESNAGRAKEYRTLFPAMIADWRSHWAGVNRDEENFPFLFVQLANYQPRQAEPVQEETGWPGLREAQHMTLSLPKTGEAVIIDVGQADDIHPKDKMDVGHRLALAAEKVAYGKDVVHSGPTYQGMTVAGNKIRVTLANRGGGLTIAAHPSTQPGVPPETPAANLRGFSIAGEDRKFFWADATIDGDSVIVWSDEVTNPTAVRYAWGNNPDCNLYNKEGLPASPFRTDDWTALKK